QMIFVGDGIHRPQIENVARQLGLAAECNFLGQLPAGDAVRAQCDRAHLLVMPSFAEGLPRAMIEAMARGLPCIGSAVGGIQELLPPEDMFPPNNVEKLEAKLMEVLGDPARMQQMSRRNLVTAKRYQEGNMLSRRREFYQTLRHGTL